MDAPNLVTRRLWRVKKTEAWLTVQLSTANGTELGVQEWGDALLLQYGLDTSYLTKLCDGCNAVFNICHALDWKKEGLVMVRHNDLHDGSRTLMENPLRPQTCEMTPLSTQAVWYKVQRLSRKGMNPTQHHRNHRPWYKRATFWSVNSGGKGTKFFRTCVPWTLTQNYMWQVIREVYSRHRKGKTKDVTGGLPPATPKLVVLHCLSWWVNGWGGGGYPENGSHPPHNKVAETIIKDVWIRQE